LLAILTGCSFLKPSAGEEHDYLLSPIQSPGSSAAQNRPGAYVVRVLPVEVPEYLQTSDMAVQVGTNEVFFAKFNHWAEPLETGIRRVLVENLRAEDSGREVFTDEPAPEGLTVYMISVQVMEFEAKDINGQGSIDFEAAWEISSTGKSPPIRGFFRAPPLPWHPGDYAGLARQLSQALTDVSRHLDRAISAQAHAQSVQ
jgi:hypothetical protein